MGQLQEKYKHYREPQKYMEADVYPYFRAIEGKQGTEVEMGGHKVLMFGSNAYTGLTGDQRIILHSTSTDRVAPAAVSSMVRSTFTSSLRKRSLSSSARKTACASLQVSQ